MDRLTGVCRFLLVTILLAGCSANGHRPDAAPLAGPSLDREVARLMAAAQVPGLALAVVRDGRIVHLRAYGERDVAQHLPLTTSTTMYAASLTKALFAYAVLTLSPS